MKRKKKVSYALESKNPHEEKNLNDLYLHGVLLIICYVCVYVE